MLEDLIPWLCLPCDWKAYVRLGDLPPVCEFCKRCLTPVFDQDGIDILEV
jgi:hypothetical protein